MGFVGCGGACQKCLYEWQHEILVFCFLMLQGGPADARSGDKGQQIRIQRGLNAAWLCHQGRSTWWSTLVRTLRH